MFKLSRSNALTTTSLGFAGLLLIWRWWRNRNNKLASAETATSDSKETGLNDNTAIQEPTASGPEASESLEVPESTRSIEAPSSAEAKTSSEAAASVDTPLVPSSAEVNTSSEAVASVETPLLTSRAEVDSLSSKAEASAPPPAEEPQPRQGLHCLNCGRYDAPLKRCSRCGSVWFCSVDCQRVAWKTHKSDCAKLAQAKSAATPSSKATPASTNDSSAKNAMASASNSEPHQSERNHRDFGIVAEEQSGAKLFQSGQYREAHSAFSRMQSRAQEMGLLNEEGRALRLIGNALDKLNAPEAEVEDMYKRALRIAHQHDDMKLSFDVLTGMASHATKVDDADLAEHLYLQALTLAERVLTQDEVATAESNVAMCFARVDARRSESYSHFRKAISLQQKSDSKAMLHANLASALCLDGRNDEGLVEYKRALDLAHDIGSHRTEMNVLANLSNIYDELGNPEEARKCRERLAALRASLAGSANTDLPRTGDRAVCAICLELLESQDKPLTILPCTHTFHKACWDNCLEQRCPLCRDPLSFAAR